MPMPFMPAALEATEKKSKSAAVRLSIREKKSYQSNRESNAPIWPDAHQFWTPC
jgi:hypothetical protein